MVLVLILVFRLVVVFLFVVVRIQPGELSVFGDFDFDCLSIGFLDVRAIERFAVFRFLNDMDDVAAGKVVLDGFLHVGGQVLHLDFLFIFVLLFARLVGASAGGAESDDQSEGQSR